MVTLLLEYRVDQRLDRSVSFVGTKRPHCFGMMRVARCSVLGLNDDRSLFVGNLDETKPVD